MKWSFLRAVGLAAVVAVLTGEAYGNDDSPGQVAPEVETTIAEAIKRLKACPIHNNGDGREAAAMKALTELGKLDPL